MNSGGLNKKRVLFITTHNLATNPRLVKEIDLALLNNLDVSIVCCEFNNFSKATNDQLKKRLIGKVSYKGINAGRKSIGWLISSFWNVASNFLLFFKPNDLFLLSISCNKRSWGLLNYTKNIHDKVDFVIGHNPGSFYPVYKFAKENKIPFGIDIEDYHPGETDDIAESKRFEKLMGKILPLAGYLTAASPLIMEYSKNILKNSPAISVILNYFPADEFVVPEIKSDDEKLSLTWFSQNISYGRGLENIIPVIRNNPSVELHLFGNCNESFSNEWLTGMNNVFLHSFLPQRELHRQLSKYDIGLALEPGKDLNNELLISNKILAYMQAGLYIVASKSKAQQLFFQEHIFNGQLTGLDATALAETLNELIEKKSLIRNASLERFRKAKENCWETESNKLLEVWKKTFQLN